MARLPMAQSGRSNMFDSRLAAAQALAAALTAGPLLFNLPSPGVAASPPAQSAETPQARSEARLAKRIDFGLREGRIAEAMLDAEIATKRFPRSGLIRRRLGQVRLCKVIQADTGLTGTLEAIRCAPLVRRSVSWFSDIKADSRLHKAEENEPGWEQQLAQLKR